ncbi:MAG: DUF742 domain-containing protein [Actinomycetes bacterium]
MTFSGNHSEQVGPAFRVRSYVMTQGRTRSAVDLPLETLIKITPEGIAEASTLTLESRQIIVLCQSPISIAEISAHLGVPLGVARVLVGDLAQAGLVISYRPQYSTTGQSRPDQQLLERVLDGIQAL